MIAIRPRWRLSSALHRLADWLVDPEVRVIADAIDRDSVLAEVELDLLEAKLGPVKHQAVPFYRSLAAWLTEVGE